MDLERSAKLVRNAWLAGLLSVLWCIATLILIRYVDFITIYSPKPWALSYNILESIFWLLFILLIILGVYRRLLFAAIFLFTFFCLDKLIALIFISERWNIWENIYWLAISLMFGYFFFQGVRGAVAYRRLKAKKP